MYSQTHTEVSGDIGCMVQDKNNLVITGFNELPAESMVIIKARIDISNSPIMATQITTYANNDLFDINTNGSIIDRLTSNMILNMDTTNASNIN